MWLSVRSHAPLGGSFTCVDDSPDQLQSSLKLAALFIGQLLKDHIGQPTLPDRENVFENFVSLARHFDKHRPTIRWMRSPLDQSGFFECPNRNLSLIHI